MRLSYLTFFLVLLASTVAEQWYQQGNPKFLDWNNFDHAVSEPNTYKFVKYFTHSCRYCRMLKQVEEQLQAEKQWIFEFYQVDCTLHYDLCQAKANPSAFPFVGIYNLKGQFQAQIGGYYPLDTMREAFSNIQGRQIEALKVKGVTVKAQQVRPQQSQQNSRGKISQRQQKVKTDEEHEIQKRTHSKKESESEDRSLAVSQGIKLLFILVGFWLFSKQIKPYLEQQNLLKSRTIQISAPKSRQMAKSNGNLLSDTL